MATTDEHITQRVEIVMEHIRRENTHDLDAIMDTFGQTGRYDDEPWGEHHEGLPAVRSYYATLMHALPDLHIDVEEQYVTDDNVVLEVTISGTHRGSWRGLPPTGRRIEFPLCAIFSFDEANKIAGERIYYDRADVLHQLGVYFEPDSPVGRLTTVLLHPVTMIRALYHAAASR